METIDFEQYIEDIPDFPQPGVVFKDISPLLAHPEAFTACTKALADPYRELGVTKVIGSEARGFIMGAPVANELSAGFVPARKPGKLPRETVEQEYDLEYGTATLQIHKDALGPGDKVVLVDDLAATGGTLAAQVKLVETLGAELVGIACFMELEFLHPRDMLAKVTDVQLHSLVQVS